MTKENIVTVADGTRLETTQTGKERERYSRLYGVFMEVDPATQQMKLIMRNFPSQRIMNEWMQRTGWDSPARKGSFVIMRGTPVDGLKVTQEREFGQAHIEGVQAVPTPTQPRPPAAPKPEAPVASEAEASEVSDVSTPEPIKVEFSEDGGIDL